MRSPSIKKIQEGLGLSKEDSKILKELMRIASPSHCRDHTVDGPLNYALLKLEGFSIEAIRVDNWINHYYQDIGLLYVNLGDTYKTTLCYDTVKEVFFIGSWGDWAERQKDGYVL
jgi:hypothetical protein